MKTASIPCAARALAWGSVPLVRRDATQAVAAQRLCRVGGASREQSDAVLAMHGCLPSARTARLAPVPDAVPRHRPHVIAAESHRSTVLAAVSEVDGTLTRLGARAHPTRAKTLGQQYRTHCDAVGVGPRAGGGSLLDSTDTRRQVHSAHDTRMNRGKALPVQRITHYIVAGGGRAPCFTAASRRIESFS